MADAPTTDPRIYRGLRPEQADGLACIVCGTNYLTDAPKSGSVPVGRSVTNSQVFACKSPRPCAGQLGHPAGVAL